jgi:hypothetical protein
MSDQPKTLILTTNRTEDGAPVYAPCGDLRELIAEWISTCWSAVMSDEENRERRLAREECAKALEAALQPSGDLLVARPLQILVSNFDSVQRAVAEE